MTSPIPEVDEWTTYINVPDDGDDFAAAGFKVPFEALSNRVNYIQNRRSLAYHATNTAEPTAAATDADFTTLNTLAVPMQVGEVALIWASANVWAAGGTPSDIVHKVVANTTEVALQIGSAAGGGTPGGKLPFGLAASYVATAAGTVTFTHRFGFAVGSGSVRGAACLNILKVR